MITKANSCLTFSLPGMATGIVGCGSASLHLRRRRAQPDFSLGGPSRTSDPRTKPLCKSWRRTSVADGHGSLLADLLPALDPARANRLRMAELCRRRAGSPAAVVLGCRRRRIGAGQQHNHSDADDRRGKLPHHAPPVSSPRAHVALAPSRSPPPGKESCQPRGRKRKVSPTNAAYSQGAG